jgi:hypothetical protein
MNVEIKDFVGVYEEAFSEEYCKKVVKYFDDMQNAGNVQNRQVSEGALKSVKDDTACFAHSAEEVSFKLSGDLMRQFNEVFWGDIYLKYANTFSVLKNAGAHASFAFKIQKTAVGEGYHVWHFESDTRETSNRLLTWILYLNDVEEGGETEFLYYPRRIKPKTGTLILWPAAFTHAHRGNPPISNTKYIVTGWVEF